MAIIGALAALEAKSILALVLLPSRILFLIKSMSIVLMLENKGDSWKLGLLAL